LPSSGTTFNIVSFGNDYRGLWPASVSYDTENVSAALQHIDRMHADYGGTEIARALSGAVEMLTVVAGQPTAVFLLTDGEAWDLHGVNQLVREAVRAGEEANAPLRFFCLGIGGSPSKVGAIASVSEAGD
jgi:Mg-chelatase subunit ChlD